MSVVGLAIIVLVILLAVFYKFIVPYPEDIGAVVKFQEAPSGSFGRTSAGNRRYRKRYVQQNHIRIQGALTMGVGCLIIVVPFGGILGLVAGYWNGKFISNFIMRVSDVFFGSAGADTGNVRFIHNGTQYDQRHAGPQCFLVALVYEAGIRHSGFHEKRDVYPICGGSRSRQEPHTVQRDIAKHLIAYSYKSDFGYGLGYHGWSHSELRGNGRTAAYSFSWGYGFKRSKLLARPVVDVGIPGSGHHDNSAGLQPGGRRNQGHAVQRRVREEEMENKLTTEKVVDVKDLHISFRTFKGYPHVLNGVNVHVNKKRRE